MVLAGAMDQTTDHDPVRVADAARPRPLPIEPVTAGRDLGLAGRRRRRGDAGVQARVPDIVLRLVGKMRKDAGVVAEIVEAPGGRAAGRPSELDRYVELDLVVVLVAAPALGHDGPDQPGIDVLFDRLARDVAITFRLERPLLQPGRQRPGAVDELRAARDAFRRCCRGQRFHGRHVVLPRAVLFAAA